MKRVREIALQKRLQGFSYNEIAKEYGVPKSTLSGWFGNVVLSDKARKRLSGRVREGVLHGLIKRNKEQTYLAQKRAASIQHQAKLQIQKLTRKDLMIVGAVLYWAEGYKRPILRGGIERTSHVISFVNSDPEMILVFIKFLLSVLEIPQNKLRLVMRLYPHINEQLALRYWMKITGLSRESFFRSTFLVSLASKHKRPYNRLPYGTLQIGVHDTNKFHQLIGLINGVKAQW